MRKKNIPDYLAITKKCRISEKIEGHWSNVITRSGINSANSWICNKTGSLPRIKFHFNSTDSTTWLSFLWNINLHINTRVSAYRKTYSRRPLIVVFGFCGSSFISVLVIESLASSCWYRRRYESWFFDRTVTSITRRRTTLWAKAAELL